MDDVELRELVPRVLGVLVGRGADFATAEDAVQEALIRALAAWGDELPADTTGWLITVAWRAFLDMTRSDASRHDRELRFDTEPPVGAVPGADDTSEAGRKALATWEGKSWLTGGGSAWVTGNRATAGMPSSRQRSTWPTSRSTDRRSIPGIEGTASRFASPSSTKKGWIRSAGPSRFSATRRRTQPSRRSRRGRLRGNGACAAG